MARYENLPDDIKSLISEYVGSETYNYYSGYCECLCDYECMNSTPNCTEGCREYYKYEEDFWYEDLDFDIYGE